MPFPLLGQTRDFNPLDCAHAGRTQKQSRELNLSFAFKSNVYVAVSFNKNK